MIINHAFVGAPGATDLDLSFAGWVATLKDAKASSTDDGESGEVDVATLDYVFKRFGSK